MQNCTYFLVLCLSCRVGFWSIGAWILSSPLVPLPGLLLARITHQSNTSYNNMIYLKFEHTYSSGSIEIDHIDVSNLRRFSSRRNRIGSNRTNVMKMSVQWEFEYTFFALTLNPMGKTRCLEISDYAGDTAGLLSSSPQNQREGSRTFNGVYTVFTYSNVIMETK